MAELRDSRPNNLPIHLTSFVGRTQQIAEVKRLLTGTRLLTLTGTGGCGKTRLALQVAAELLPDYAEGAWIADLAALSDPALVPHTVASALDVPEQPGRPLTDTLVDTLRPKSLLLVLDNCEHLLGACGHVADALLRRCPKLRILATSREGLGIAGESVYRVPSLSLPDPAHLPSLQEVAQYEAACLFIERASRSHPAFLVTNGNLPAVVHVCCRLDGLPLAIELAAARVKALTVEEIAARLEDRFRLLTGGSRTALPRQQTLRSTMDWSHNLLSEKERALLRRLSVFAGGSTLEGVEAICMGGILEPAETLDLLTHLVDKSLVLAETQGAETRYRLLETVRQYARERLLEAGEAEDVRRQHRDWYLAFAERGDPELRGPRDAQWLERFETEHDNLRTALEWSKQEKGGAEAWLRLAGALNYFWFRHDHWNEGMSWIEGALARSDEAPRFVLPRALRAAAHLASRVGFHELATAWGEKGLALCRELGETENQGFLLYHLGVAAMRQADHQRAKALFEESADVSRDLENKWLYGLTLAHLGILARYQGDDERAAAFHTQGLAVLRAVGTKFTTAWALNRYGRDVALRQGRYDEAAASFKESLLLSREVRSRWMTEECLEGLAHIASARGHYECAARLFGAAEAQLEIVGQRYVPLDQASHDQWVVPTRAALEDTAFAASWSEGRAMTLEQAVEYALTSAEVVLSPTKGTGRPVTQDKRVDLLTPREREVATLIASGLTNREIASRLVIAERTAEGHVQAILNKLTFNSRAQIAAWAVEHGLHAPSKTQG